MPKKENLLNQTFGIIKIIAPAPNRGNKTYWLCECIKCGKQKEIRTTHIKDGSIKSCGCGCLQINMESQEKNKICEICKKEFQIKDYGWTRKYCYDCSPSYTTSEERIKSLMILRKAMKEQAVKIKGGKCEKCGYNKCIGALHFHHRDPKEKSFSLAQDGNTHSWTEYLNEVMKCDLLCANCHAEEHFLDN